MMTSYHQDKKLVHQFKAALEQRRISKQKTESTAILDHHSEELVAKKDMTYPKHKDLGHTDHQHTDNHTDVHSQRQKPKQGT